MFKKFLLFSVLLCGFGLKGCHPGWFFEKGSPKTPAAKGAPQNYSYEFPSSSQKRNSIVKNTAQEEAAANAANKENKGRRHSLKRVMGE